MENKETAETSERTRKERTGTDWIALIIFFAVLISSCIVTYYLIINNIHSCTTSPLKYEADKLAKEGNFTYSFAYFSVYEQESSIVPLKIEQINLKKNKVYPLA